MNSTTRSAYVMTWTLEGNFEIQLPADCDLSDLAALEPIVRSVRAFALTGTQRS